VADVIVLFPELQRLVGLSRVTVWRMEKARTFPAHIYLAPGARSVGWKKTEVVRWLEARNRARLRAAVAKVI
jgi:predicted DNA-binding transcriptional regulator AlpA